MVLALFQSGCSVFVGKKQNRRKETYVEFEIFDYESFLINWK